ncbi:hypothetical protein BCV70DRAFT_142650, partial [Testicularia cyperi]
DFNDSSTLAICRICLDGPTTESEGGESLGRLLSPCRCKGTMKYVHATCLDRWRTISVRTSSSVACDQCGAPYRFRRSRFVGIATSPTLLFLLSCFLFLLLIWTVGFAASFWMDMDSVSADNLSAETQVKAQSGSWWPWSRSPGDELDLVPVPWTELDVDYSYSAYFGYGGIAYEPAAYLKLIKEAVRQFTSGEAAEAVKEAVGFDDVAEPTELEEHETFWSALKREWMYGDGGLWPGQGPEKESFSNDAASQKPAKVAEDQSKRERLLRPNEKYDARLASPYDPSGRARAERDSSRRRGKSPRAASHSRQPTRAVPSWLNKIILQFSLGFSLVGIVSFVNLLFGFSFVGPFNLHNFGLGRSFARMTNNQRRNGGQDGANMASVVIVILVIIGVVRALHLVYRAVRSISRRFLSRLEEAIVDWHGEGE